MIHDIKSIIGIPVQENLETHYTLSRDLIRNLREIRFTGFLLVEFWQYEGYMIFDTGNIVQGFEFYHDQEFSGISALIHIHHQLKKREGSISTFRVNPERIPLLLVSLQSRIMRSEKNLGENGIKQFVEEALEETDYGFIRVEYGRDEATAYILILNGSVLSTILRRKDGKQSREKGVGRLFPLAMRMCSTIKNAVYLESSDALESYVDGQKISEMLDLIEGSDTFLELVTLYKELMKPHLAEKEIGNRIDRAWKESCMHHKIEHIEMREGRLEGLEHLSLSSLGDIISTFTAMVKPELDELLKEDSITEQLAGMFWRSARINLPVSASAADTADESRVK
jgi:hypothetical protein